MLKRQSTAMSARINTKLWDDATGIYRQLDANPMKRRGFSAAISPTSFYPMLAGIASTERAERMVREHLTNASGFCVDPGDAFRRAGEARCAYALPSISRSDPNFYDNSYWRGRAWGPLNLLTWIALSNPAYGSSARVVAARKGLCMQSIALLLGEWRAKRHVHENYNSTSGEGCDVGNSNPFYHWGANMGWIALREAARSSA
jgi:neutral trehalase